MKIFISWSGPRSRAVAQALYDWLPRVIQAVRPWMSAEDIEAGARWSEELARELQTNGYGVLCLTPENLDAPWIHFEAGALSRLLETARVCPVLFDLTPAELHGPLTQFQAVELKRSSVQRFVKSLNRALGEHQLRDDQLDEAFDVWWPRLEARLTALEGPAEKPGKKPTRPLPEMVAELLDLARAQERRAQDELRRKQAEAEAARRLMEARARRNRDRAAELYPFKAGDRVRHHRFGVGTITHLSVLQRGAERLSGPAVSILFDDEGVGVKRLLLGYAGLEPIVDGGGAATTAEPDANIEGRDAG